MANQLINFEQGSSTTGDSGEREADAAIKPVVAGERAASTVIDRPLENLRERTEFLRSAVEELMFRADSDHWIITGGNDLGMIVGGATAFPTVTWDAVGGTFTVSEDIVVQPLLAPEVDKYAEKIYSFTDGVPATATFTFSTAQFDHQNANALRIIWEAKPAAEISGGTCATTLEGTPEHILRIVIRNDGATRASDVHSALGTLFLAPSPFTYVGMGGTATTFLLAVPADYDYLLVGTYSRELHHIPAAEFVNYFGPPALNALIPDGDTLGIYYPFLVDPNPLTFGGRRQATTDTGAAPNTGVTAAQLFQTSIEPEKIPYAIPLCRRIGTHLVFVDGTVVAHGQTATFGGEGSIDALQAAYAAHVGGSADKHPAADITTALIAGSPESAAASDVQTQLEALYGHVNDRVEIAALADNAGIDSGDTLVGCDAVAGTPTSLAQGTVKTQAGELLTAVNARARTAGEKITGVWHHPSSGVVQEYGNDVYLKTRMDGSRSGGAAGPNVSMADIERGFIRRATIEYPFMWGNPRSPCNRGSIGTGVIRKQAVLNVQRDTASLPEAGMYSRIILSGGLGSSNVYVQDVYAISTAPGVTGTINLAVHLPSGAGESWDIVSLCAIGSGNFGVLFRDTTPALDTYRVHAFTMSHTSGGGYAVVPRTGMPAQGVALTGSGVGVGPTNNSNIVSDGTYLVTANGWNKEDGTNTLSRITLSDGTLLDGSSSYSSANCYTTGGLTIISASVALVAYTTYDTITTLPQLKICFLTGLTEQASPLTLGATSTDICADICHDGSMIYAPILSGTVITYCLESGEDSTLTSGFIVTGSLRYCCFDGRSLWLTEFIGTTINRTNLIGVDVGRIRSGDPATTMEFAGARKYFMLRADEECSAEEAMGRVMYDGGSILLGLDMASGQPLTGKYARLSCATDR